MGNLHAALTRPDAPRHQTEHAARLGVHAQHRVQQHTPAIALADLAKAAVTARASFGPTLIMTWARTAPSSCSGATRTL